MHLEPELSPLEKAHAKVYRCRIKRVELSIEHKWFRDSLALGKEDHIIVCKFLKDLVVSVRIGIRHITQLYVSATEMVALLLMA